MSNSTAFQTYQAIGNREDLTDVLVNISPTETPMLSDFGHTTAQGTYHEWQTDSLAAAAANAQIEGNDFSFARATATTRTGNYTQIFHTTVEVSDTQRVVNSAGRNNDEMSYQMAKKMKEHARDIEFAIAGTGTTASGASGTARTMRGVFSWIATNTASATATGINLAETLFNDTLQLAWAQGGKPDTAYVHGFNKRKISGFSSSNTKNIEAQAQTLVNSIDIYESDFGPLKIKLDRYVPTDTVGQLEVDLWKVAYLRPTHSVEVAKVGDATRSAIVTELTLESRQEKGSASILKTATS